MKYSIFNSIDRYFFSAMVWNRVDIAEEKIFLDQSIE